MENSIIKDVVKRTLHFEKKNSRAREYYSRKAEEVKLSEGYTTPAYLTSRVTSVSGVSSRRSSSGLEERVVTRAEPVHKPRRPPNANVDDCGCYSYGPPDGGAHGMCAKHFSLGCLFPIMLTVIPMGIGLYYQNCGEYNGDFGNLSAAGATIGGILGFGWFVYTCIADYDK